MNKIIQSSLLTLGKSQKLLVTLTDEELSNASVSPYYSSIGSHIRHIYDFYDCALNVEDGCVDLTDRKRITSIETCCNSAMDYFEALTKRLKSLDNTLTHEKITVIDDLGDGKIEIDYTYAALLAQGNSHTIHHYAIINYILDRLNISINDSDFGYNPTTPKLDANLS